MRRIFLSILITILAISTLVNAETVQLSFSGVTTEGRYCLLDSVRIENLTQKWSQTLDCSIDTTYELPVAQIPTGIDNIVASEDGGGLLSVSQDFAMGNTVVSINPIDDGIVRMRVIDMMGRVVIEHAEYLSAGQHQYILQLGTPQTYMISVVTDSEYASTKILNLASSGRCDLSHVTSLPFADQASSHRKARASSLDLMRYTGYTNQKGVAVASEPITQYQSNPELIVFQFAPVSKGQEGMYVGMMGFNSALYPYSFDILTSSNLSAHQNFVSNLSMANGTILYHAVYTSLNNIVNAPVPEKLENVSLVTFTDGLDIGSWRMNSNYPSEALYLAAVNKQIHRTYIDGIKLDAYSIGVKGSDVTDEERFESDLHQLASDSANVFSVSNMDEVNARFREIAAKIYNTKVNYTMTIKLPAPNPGSIIRFTFDDVSDADNSIYYIEGTYDYDFGANMGVLKDVKYSGVKSTNGTTWTSVPDGIFDIFTIHNIASNLGERLYTSSMRQWTYISSTKKWQINSEFDPSIHSSSTEERSSASVILVLDCSSSLSSDFSKMQSAANNFLSILTGKGNISKPIVSSATVKSGDLHVTLSATISSSGNLSIMDKGFCISEYPNMDNAKFYSCGAGEENFEYLITDLIEGKTYYVRPYAENHLGRTYGAMSSFVAVTATLPEVSIISTKIIDVDKITCTGQITFDGNAPIIERGFCWSLKPDPTIDDNYIIVETSNETFNGTINNLETDTEIYIRAYAKNRRGICYSLEAFNTSISAIFYTAEQKINPSSAFNEEVLCHNFNAGKGSIVLRSGVASIRSSAFSNRTDLTSITIPNSITSIGENAFYGCTGLTIVKIGNSVTSIEKGAFYGCNSLTSVKIGNSVNSIGASAFQNCTSLTSIEIPNSVTSIGHSSFYGCTGLTTIEIPNSVTSIGSSAFLGCAGLTSIEIPNSVTSIGYSTFSGCSKVSSITCRATTPLTCDALTFYKISTSIPVYVPAESVDAYKKAKGWEIFTNIQAISE